MKSKIFSALLMGAFALTSMSTLYSCKDYDDDINSLDTKQQELLSQLDALQSDVTTKYNTLNDQLTTASKNAEQALSDLSTVKGSVSSVQDAVSKLESSFGDLSSVVTTIQNSAKAAGEAAAKAQTTADDALTSANGAQMTAEEAQKAADAAQATADSALAKATEAIEVAKKATSDQTGTQALAKAEQALEEISTLSSQVGSLETLTEGIPVLKEQIEKATDDIATLKTQVDKYQTYFDSLFQMVTSVELFGTYSGTGHNQDLPAALSIMYGTVGESSVFGDDETYTKSSPLINFTKGDDIKGNAGVIVRVNPVNAVFTGKNIKVINSKGEDMSDYIQVASVEPYDELLTRGSKINSGLYKVNFELVDGVDLDAFAKAVQTTVDGDKKDVLFAVAINNTDTTKADRYVASTFDMTLASTKYTNLSELDYSVTGKDGEVAVGNIKNRWTGSKAVDDNDKEYEGPKEYTWKENTTTNPTPATAATEDNVTPDLTDYRSQKNFLPVNVGVPFTVKLGKNSDKIAYYYVVLDKAFAVESAPSEWNAWIGYSYTGLGKTVAADDKLDITINSESADGDMIGFRVFAVNYDGTLVDPDGKAFYVSVGDEAQTETVPAPITPIKAGVAASSDYIALTKTFKATKNAVSNTIYPKDLKDGSSYVDPSAELSYKLYKDKNGNEAKSWDEAKFIKVEMNDPKYFLDDGTFTFVIEAKSEADRDPRILNTLTVNVKKQMPTGDDKKVTFKAAQLVDGVYTCYLDPNKNDWTQNSENGSKDLWNAVTGMDDNAYTWTFKDAAKNGDKLEDVTVTASGSEDESHKGYVYDLSVAQSFIDSKTPHATKITYDFGEISLYQKEGNYVTGDYTVTTNEVNTIFACAVEPSVLEYTWNQKTVNKVKKDVNFINYSENEPGKDVLSAGEKLTQYIKATSSVDNELFTYHDKTYGYIWNGGSLYFANSITAELLSDETQKADYYTVTYNTGTNDFDFEFKSESTNPTADVPSTLVIKAKDAFGHENTIAELPFTVKRR